MICLARYQVVSQVIILSTMQAMVRCTWLLCLGCLVGGEGGGSGGGGGEGGDGGGVSGGGGLVVEEADLDSLTASRVETEATLVEKLVREGECEGSKV